MRSITALLAARSSVLGKYFRVSASPLSAANGSRSDSRQRRMSSRSVRMVSKRWDGVTVVLQARRIRLVQDAGPPRMTSNSFLPHRHDRAATGAGGIDAVRLAVEAFILLYENNVLLLDGACSWSRT